MLQQARVDCLHFVEDLDLVVRVRHDHCDGEDADEKEKKGDHEDEVDDEECGSLTALLVQVKQVQLLVRHVLPADQATLKVLHILLISESLGDWRGFFLLLLGEVLFVGALDFFKQVLLFLIILATFTRCIQTVLHSLLRGGLVGLLI